MHVRVVCTLPVAVLLLTAHLRASDVVDLAASFIGHPYVWGAEGPKAFDCSGLTQYVFREFGVTLPRRAINQADAGDPTGRRFERGDLLFFASDSRRSLVTHVGISEGGGTMINASKRHGRVRRDRLDEEFWTTTFMFARRVIDSGNEMPRERRERDSGRRAEKNEGRREAARVLGRLADRLLRRLPRD